MKTTVCLYILELMICWLFRIAHELLGQLAAQEMKWTANIVPPLEMAELVKLVETKEITGNAIQLLDPARCC